MLGIGAGLVLDSLSSRKDTKKKKK
jgi:hypothetical protein